MTERAPIVEETALVEFTAAYLANVQIFVQSGGSSALNTAYDIARDAFSRGISLIDLSAAHHKSMADYIKDHELDAETIRHFENFHLEVLTVYDMALLGYRNSISSLRNEVSERKRVEQDLRFATFKLARQRDDLDTKITERTREIEAVAEDLRRSNARLIEYSREQAEFTYSISHDMKSPTNTIWMLLDVLREDYRDELTSDAQELLDSALETVQRMGRLTEDVLEYSRTIEEDIDPVPIDLGTLCRGIVADLAADTKKVGAKLVIRDLPVVEGSAVQLRVLLQNLLSNAIKFRSPEREPRIEVSSRPGTAQGEAQIIVSDNGIGIAPEYHDRVFGLFQRLHNREEYAGSGLGLTLCKRIASNHGGQIGLESEFGVGTRFHITLRTERKVNP
ncbi:MAG: sensor histidine kinase [Paracoccaceae bacterium]